MELVVRKNELLRELQLFQGIVERKNTIPILANVLIEAKGDEVRMLATDLEVALRSRCHASVAKGGSLTLPAKKLYEIVKALPETDVRIEEDGFSMLVDVPETAPAIVRALVEHGAEVREAFDDQPPLEEVYLKLLSAPA